MSHVPHYAVYVFASKSAPRVKLGMSSDPDRRKKQLERKHGPLVFEHAWRFPRRLVAERAERALHWHFRAHAITSSWTGLGERPEVEWFDAAVLHHIHGVDVELAIKAFLATRVVEVRLLKSDLDALRERGLTLEDAVRRVVDAG